MFCRKISPKIITFSKTVTFKFVTEAGSPVSTPAVTKGSVGAVFAEDGKPFQVTLEEGKVYSWCPCGQSRKKPFCDGTHKEVNLKSEQKFKPVKIKVEKTGQYWLCNCRKTKNIPFCDGSHKQNNKASK
ncbi:iron-binding zinc finger CDGSH type domain-containing protein [Phthorimaea operculella]|nr:iron-binding zinc finger CDGSH type domain-containing protein [Phthorimaea operculella]